MQKWYWVNSMKADFEKGTKICSRCKKELPIDMFDKDKSRSDNLRTYCKQCRREYDRKISDKRENVFGRRGNKRGNSGKLKRDYELTKEQLSKREYSRKKGNHKKTKEHGVLVWYSGNLEKIDSVKYRRIMIMEYQRQKYCAVRGYVGRVKPSEHFLFDFDLEQMLKDKVEYYNGKPMKRWWEGNIRHWTVKDGIWKE